MSNSKSARRARTAFASQSFWPGLTLYDRFCRGNEAHRKENISQPTHDNATCSINTADFHPISSHRFRHFQCQTLVHQLLVLLAVPAANAAQTAQPECHDECVALVSALYDLASAVLPKILLLLARMPDSEEDWTHRVYTKQAQYSTRVTQHRSIAASSGRQLRHHWFSDCFAR